MRFEDLVWNPEAVLTYLFDRMGVASGFEMAARVIKKASSEISFKTINPRRAYANKSEYKNFINNKVIKETAEELCYEL